MLVEEHNQQYALGLKSFNLSMNQFSDMEWKEFERVYLPQRRDRSSKQTNSFRANLTETAAAVAATSFDWRDYPNIVTKVKDQVGVHVSN